MDVELIKRVHEVNFDILSEIHRICKENNLCYFLDSGTLLGAVRHQDFIPWDDDLDIAVRREDFPRFVEVMRRELDDRFEFVMPDSLNGNFYDFIPRVQLKHSQRRNPTEEDLYYDNKQNKLCSDVFILDKVPSSKMAQKMQVLWTKALYGMAMGHRYSVDYSKYTPGNRILVAVLSRIGKCIKTEKIMRWQEKRARKYENTDATCRMVLNYPLPFIHQIYEEIWFKETASLPMHGGEFSGPKMYHEVLTSRYGDYMKLPPEDKRVPEHDIRELKY